jgi:hypothetical protein
MIVVELPAVMVDKFEIDVEAEDEGGTAIILL